MKIFIYQCKECEEEYRVREKKQHLCDWVDCDSTEPLELIGEEVSR